MPERIEVAYLLILLMGFAAFAAAVLALRKRKADRIRRSGRGKKGGGSSR